MKIYVSFFYSALFLMSFNLQAAQLEKSKSGLIILISDKRTGETAEIIRDTFALPYPGYITLPDELVEQVKGYIFLSGARVELDLSEKRRQTAQYKITGLPKDSTEALKEEYE